MDYVYWCFTMKGCRGDVSPVVQTWCRRRRRSWRCSWTSTLPVLSQCSQHSTHYTQTHTYISLAPVMNEYWWCVVWCGQLQSWSGTELVIRRTWVLLQLISITMTESNSVPLPAWTAVCGKITGGLEEICSERTMVKGSELRPKTPQRKRSTLEWKSWRQARIVTQDQMETLPRGLLCQHTWRSMVKGKKWKVLMCD